MLPPLPISKHSQRFSPTGRQEKQERRQRSPPPPLIPFTRWGRLLRAAAAAAPRTTAPAHPRRSRCCSDRIRHPSWFSTCFLSKPALTNAEGGGGFPAASAGQRPPGQGSLPLPSSSRQNPLTYSLGAKTAFPFRRREAPRSRAGGCHRGFPFGSGRVSLGKCVCVCVCGETRFRPLGRPPGAEGSRAQQPPLSRYT